MTYEHKVVEFKHSYSHEECMKDGARIAELVERYGKDGWEMIGFHKYDLILWFFFKRPTTP
jgi:hypothetical protein